MHKRGFTAVELVLVVVVLAIVVSVTLVQVDRRMQARMREESAANLRALYRLHSRLPQFFPKDEPQDFRSGRLTFPPLSSIPGQLTLQPTDGIVWVMQSRNELTTFISPAHPEAEHMRENTVANPVSAITDASYWYMGYALPNEKAGLAFVDAYRKAIEESGQPPTGEIELESPIEIIDVEYAHKPMSVISPLNTMVSTSFFDQDGKQVGSGVSIESEPNEVAFNYGGSFRIIPLPIFIERPSLQRGGSNVVWGDGTVEFIPYPGPWPMTERFIKALESLDALKVKE